MKEPDTLAAPWSALGLVPPVLPYGPVTLVSIGCLPGSV